MKFIRKLFKHNSNTNIEHIELPINREKNIYKPKNQCVIGGIVFKIGDKVICRSNECDPLLIGYITEFFDNNGKWTNPTPHVKDESDGKIYGVMGFVKPYSEDLLKQLEGLHPLKQWNLLSHESSPKYTDKDIIRKQKQYDDRMKIKSNKY